MRAVVITAHGGPEVLELRDVPEPIPGRGEVRVRVHATALNRADLLQRAGLYPAPPDAPADIPGLEFAGVVDRVGDAVAQWKAGDRVFGIAGGGAYADMIVVHERTLARTPDALDDVGAAAVPEAFITAHDALFRLGGVTSGSRVLVHAIGSGVGLAAAQLAHAAHATVFGTARTRTKLARANEYGMDRGFAPDAFDDDVKGATDGEGVDTIVDFVGASYLARNLRALAPRGRLVCVGTMGGTQGEIDLGSVLRRRLTIVGTVLRSRPLEEKIAATRRFAREVVPLLATGVVKPVVDTVMPIEQVRDAHVRMAGNETFGKIVLTLR